MSKVFSCLLIGLGDIGLNYDLYQDDFIQTHSKAFYFNSGFDLKAAVDINKESCNVFSKNYNTKTFNNIENALTEIKPELVIVAVNSSYHLEVVNRVIKCFKPIAILCEKPMGLSLNEGKKIVSLCKSNNIELYVNYTRRCMPVGKEIRNRILKNQISAPIKCVFWYSKGLEHNGSHFINLCEFWFGKCLDVRIIRRGRAYKGFGFEPTIFLNFENCEVIFIPAWEEFFSHYTIEIISSNGRLYWSQNSLKWSQAQKSKNLDGYRFLSNVPEKFKIDSEKYQMHVADELYQAMTGQNSSICNGTQALETLINIDRILSLN